MFEKRLIRKTLMLLDFLGIFAAPYLVDVQSTITQEPPHQRSIFHCRSVMILPLEKQRRMHGLLMETFPAHPHPQKRRWGGLVTSSTPQWDYLPLVKMKPKCVKAPPTYNMHPHAPQPVGQQWKSICHNIQIPIPKRPANPSDGKSS